MQGHRTICRATAHKVDIVVDASDLREICQVQEEVEADLIEVQMSADQESLVGQFLEMPLGSYYCKEPGHILRFCERCGDDESRLKR